MTAIRHILVPTDGSPGAVAAAEYACDLAATLGARVTFLQSFEAPAVALPDAIYVATEAERKAIALATSERLHALGARLGRPGLRLGYEVVEGHASDVILGADARGDIDLIIMGTHGRRGVARLLFGSVAASVVRAARSPVLTVGPQSPAHAAA